MATSNVNIENTFYLQSCTGLARGRIQKHFEDVESTFSEYLEYSYGVTSEEIRTIMDNTNNFKLKNNNFHKISQLGQPDKYFHSKFCFMTVDNIKLTICKHWEG